MMARRYVCLYNVSSVQRVIDFIKTVYSFKDYIPVIIKPIGAAAQIGIPDAYKIAYKLDKPLIVLPELSDIMDVLDVRKIYLITGKGVEKDLGEIMSSKDDIAFVINGSDSDFTRQELQYGEPIKLRDISSSIPSIALAAILLYELSRTGMVGNEGKCKC